MERTRATEASGKRESRILGEPTLDIIVPFRFIGTWLRYGISTHFIRSIPVSVLARKISHCGQSLEPRYLLKQATPERAASKKGAHSKKSKGLSIPTAQPVIRPEEGHQAPATTIFESPTRSVSVSSTFPGRLTTPSTSDRRRHPREWLRAWRPPHNQAKAAIRSRCAEAGAASCYPVTYSLGLEWTLISGRSR